MEKQVIEIPQETEKHKLNRENFKSTLDIDVFAKFLGLYVMKLPIPLDIYE